MSDGEWAAMPYACDPVCCLDLCLLSSGLGQSEHRNAECCYPQTMRVETLYVILERCFVFFFLYCWSQTAGGFGPILTPSRHSLTDVSSGNKADTKSLLRPTTIKTNCFYKQAADEYFKIINSFLSAALEGFSGVFMSTSTLQDTSWSVVAAFLKDQEDSVFLYCNWQLE